MQALKREDGIENLNVDARSKPSESTRKQARESYGMADTDWIAEVSHELRLPIANIKLLIETLLAGALEDQSTATRMLTRAQNEVERLQSLVADLLSIEQLAQARDQANAEWLMFETRANYAIESTAKLAKEGHVKVLREFSDNFYVYANPKQLDQVILNLLENAIKFTPPGGTVTIRAGERAGIFSVEDTGIGIASHEIPKIFQRFYRIDRARSRGSTGLGLSIVKNIVDLHGGKITVTSQEGKGSIFQLEFPGPRSTSASEVDHD
jgi:two-component system, OmpR family, phosphate regulon sensor histidine kinase PhoR